MRVQKIARRRLLAAVVAAGGASVLEAAVAGAAKSDRERLPGVIESIERKKRDVTLRTLEGHVRVKFPSSATFSRDGSASFDDFIAGDAVVVEGHRTGHAFQAAHLSLLYRVLEGRVIGQFGDRLVTTAGEVTLDTRTVAYRGTLEHIVPLTAVQIDQDVFVTWRIEPTTGQALAKQIGIGVLTAK